MLILKHTFPKDLGNLDMDLLMLFLKSYVSTCIIQVRVNFILWQFSYLFKPLLLWRFSKALTLQTLSQVLSIKHVNKIHWLQWNLLNTQDNWTETEHTACSVSVFQSNPIKHISKQQKHINMTVSHIYGFIFGSVMWCCYFDLYQFKKHSSTITVSRRDHKVELNQPTWWKFQDCLASREALVRILHF